jgi:hypothetical protein
VALVVTVFVVAASNDVIVLVKTMVADAFALDSIVTVVAVDRLCGGFVVEVC